jgi:hypothetical protein
VEWGRAENARPYFSLIPYTDAYALVVHRFFGYFLYVRIFKNPWFTRFAVKEGRADGELKVQVNVPAEAKNKGRSHP